MSGMEHHTTRICTGGRWTLPCRPGNVPFLSPGQKQDVLNAVETKHSSAEVSPKNRHFEIFKQKTVEILESKLLHERRPSTG